MQQAAGISDKIKRFFTFERIFVLILLVAFFVRFFLLDLKLLHHDEAIHSWFSYELLTKGSWAYDPSYHGPFLYYVTAGMFSVFGDSDLIARLLPSLFGFLVLPLVYAIYRLGYINTNQTLVASIFIALSPDLAFFSRFLRHDIFMLFFTLLLLVGILAWLDRGKTRYAIVAALGAAGGMCLKEEMPVILIIFLVFFAVAIWKKRFVLPTQWKRDAILGLLIIVGIMSLLYSAFGFHTKTLVGSNFTIGVTGAHFEANTTGWYKAVDHWVGMHNQQRLGGPYYFYIPLFLLYELPIFILAGFATIQFVVKDVPFAGYYRRFRNWLRVRRFELSTGELATVTLNQLREQKCPDSVKSDEFFRFCIWWMLLTMAFYAYVGEKVPWLLIHQLLPMCFVAVYKLNWQKVMFALLGCVFLIVMTWHVAFIPADISEPIIQVQNSEDLRDVMKLMDATDHVVIASKDYWPMPWYYRGSRWDKIKFYGNLVDEDTLTKDKPGVIILHDGESLESVENYDKKTYKLSYWFSFYDNENRLLEYYLHRDGKLGSINIDVFTLRNTTA